MFPTLAVAGPEERRYFPALSRLPDPDPSIDVDPVRRETALPALAERIDEEGCPL